MFLFFLLETEIFMTIYFNFNTIDYWNHKFLVTGYHSNWSTFSELIVEFGKKFHLVKSTELPTSLPWIWTLRTRDSNNNFLVKSRNSSNCSCFSHLTYRKLFLWIETSHERTLFDLLNEKNLYCSRLLNINSWRWISRKFLLKFISSSVSLAEYLVIWLETKVSND